MNNLMLVALCLIVGTVFGAFATMVGIVLIEDIILKKEHENEKDSQRYV